MKIVIAPDSFKESLTAMQVADAVEAGFKMIFPDAQYIKLPMADGGEGTVVSMIEATQGILKEVTVTARWATKLLRSTGCPVTVKPLLLKWRRHPVYIWCRRHCVTRVSPQHLAPVN